MEAHRIVAEAYNSGRATKELVASSNAVQGRRDEAGGRELPWWPQIREAHTQSHSARHSRGHSQMLKRRV